MDKKTSKRYLKNFLEFESWRQEQGLEGTKLADMDTDLETWAEFLFYEVSSARGGRQKIVNAKAHLVLLRPEAKNQLPATAKAIRGWDKLVPPNQRPPAPRSVVFALTRLFAARGQRQMALIVALAMDCLLRISEALALTTDTVNPAAEGAGGNILVALHLEKTKTGRHKSVTVKCPALAREIREYLPTLLEGGRTCSRLFFLTAAEVNSNIAMALKELEVPYIFTCHSLRHGGATAMLMDGISIQDIKFRGRWACLQSLENYLQVWNALVLQVRTPMDVADYGRYYLQHSMRLFGRPDPIKVANFLRAKSGRGL